jgi:hypothetical protein
MATEPRHSEIMSGAPSSSEAADVNADAALVVAALGRIEAAVHDQGVMLGHLRAALGEMALAIANAKAVADSETAAAMLDEFEHRVDAMIEIASGAAMPHAAAPEAQVAEPAAEPDRVPTVSGVVQGLGPGETAPESAIAGGPAQAQAQASGHQGDQADPADQGPTVEMLTAMVEALSASIQPPVSDAPEAAAEAAEAEPAPLPDHAADHETALLASFERMEARPFPPPDGGTAVIFTTRAQPEFAPEVAAPPEPEQAAAPEPKQAAAPQSPETVEPAAAAAPDFDPADFLFGPEPEPDPAAFLLDPAPPPQTEGAAVLPQPEFVALPPEPPGPADPAAEIPQAVPPEPGAAPHDPLGALKAMSENERLAIFT